MTDIEKSQIALAAAQSAHAEILGQIEIAKDEMVKHAPAKAVAGGVDIMTAAVAHAAAEARAGFLLDAADASRVAVVEAQKLLDGARTKTAWGPKLQKGIADRLAALEAIELAQAATTEAETAFASATMMISSAYGAGIERPAWMHQERLDPPWVPPHPVPRPQYRSLAEERRLWGISK